MYNFNLSNSINTSKKGMNDMIIIGLIVYNGLIITLYFNDLYLVNRIISYIIPTIYYDD